MFSAVLGHTAGVQTNGYYVNGHLSNDRGSVDHVGTLKPNSESYYNPKTDYSESQDGSTVSWVADTDGYLQYQSLENGNEVAAYYSLNGGTATCSKAGTWTTCASYKGPGKTIKICGTPT